MGFLIIAMASFAVRHAYPPVDDRILEEESMELDFDVDSDVSDEELLDLKEELGRSNTDKARRLRIS